MAIQETKVLPTENLSLLGSEIRNHTFDGDEGPEDYLVITRGATDSLCWSLAKKIRENGFKPDIVIALGRGGFIPARVLADYLGDLQMVTIGVTSGYDVTGKRYPPVLTQPLPALGELEEKLRSVKKLGADQKISNVLVVDEIVDEGDTFQLVVKHIEETWGFKSGSENLKFASLFVKEKGLENSRVDFYLRTTAAWAIFPWEICETITKLYNRWKGYKKKPALTDAEIKERLKELGFSESDIEEFWPGR